MCILEPCRSCHRPNVKPRQTSNAICPAGQVFFLRRRTIQILLHESTTAIRSEALGYSLEDRLYQESQKSSLTRARGRFSCQRLEILDLQKRNEFLRSWKKSRVLSQNLFIRTASVEKQESEITKLSEISKKLRFLERTSYIEYS